MKVFNRWGINIFKGRIGEALIESVLQEFGYEVQRVGQEFLHGNNGNNRAISYAKRYAPDLKVIDPRTKKETLIEAKLRSARPMTATLDKVKFNSINKYYPDTIILHQILLNFKSLFQKSYSPASLPELTRSKKRKSSAS